MTPLIPAPLLDAPQDLLVQHLTSEHIPLAVPGLHVTLRRGQPHLHWSTPGGPQSIRLRPASRLSWPSGHHGNDETVYAVPLRLPLGCRFTAWVLTRPDGSARCLVPGLTAQHLARLDAEELAFLTPDASDPMTAVDVPLAGVQADMLPGRRADLTVTPDLPGLVRVNGVPVPVAVMPHFHPPGVRLCTEDGPVFLTTLDAGASWLLHAPHGTLGALTGMPDAAYRTHRAEHTPRPWPTSTTLRHDPEQRELVITDPAGERRIPLLLDDSGCTLVRVRVITEHGDDAGERAVPLSLQTDPPHLPEDALRALMTEDGTLLHVSAVLGLEPPRPTRVSALTLLFEVTFVQKTAGDRTYLFPPAAVAHGLARLTRRLDRAALQRVLDYDRDGVQVRAQGEVFEVLCHGTPVFTVTCSGDVQPTPQTTTLRLDRALRQAALACTKREATAMFTRLTGLHLLSLTAREALVLRTHAPVRVA